MASNCNNQELNDQQVNKTIGFKTIILFKDQILGIGSYGAVYKAKCDDLHCAAKIIHPTLFDPGSVQHRMAPHKEHRLPIRRFQLECEFLSTIRHPNLTLSNSYLGTHQDPETHLPVLLMELMDDSLTLFLENSLQSIPYYIQINICHDITLALSFLHSNGIVHRDLSSNNVLLIGNVRAKLTDFGMARLGDLSLHSARAHVTNTMCPGTDVYMPPEAVQDKSVYTEKIDCFSFGVIIVQILTRKFPKPGDRQMTVHVPHYPRPLKMDVPEIDRRQNHISEVDPNHPLLLIALGCLRDTGGERPSAQQLCERVAALKETAKYKIEVKDRNDKERKHELLLHQKDTTIAEKEQQLRQCREELTQQIQQIQQQNQQLSQQIQQLEIDKQQAEREKQQIIQRIEQKREQAIQQKERWQGQINQRLAMEESEQSIAVNRSCEEQISELRSQVQKEDAGGAKAGAVNKTSFNLRWRKGRRRHLICIDHAMLL